MPDLINLEIPKVYLSDVGKIGIKIIDIDQIRKVRAPVHGMIIATLAQLSLNDDNLTSFAVTLKNL